jgi:hypothetical protein
MIVFPRKFRRVATVILTRNGLLLVLTREATFIVVGSWSRDAEGLEGPKFFKLLIFLVVRNHDIKDVGGSSAPAGNLMGPTLIALLWDHFPELYGLQRNPSNTREISKFSSLVTGWASLSFLR